MTVSRLYFRKGKLVQLRAIDLVGLKTLRDADGWRLVTSSNIKALRWRPPFEGDNGRSGLGVWFAPTNADGKPSGKETIYWLSGVPFDEYAKMLTSASKGKFYYYFVRPRWPVTAGPLEIGD
jgi:hypothetical protein